MTDTIQPLQLMVEGSGSNVERTRDTPGPLGVLWRDRALWLLLAVVGAVALPFLFPALLPESLWEVYTDSCADVLLAITAVLAYLSCCRMHTGHREHRWFRILLLLMPFTWGVNELLMWVGSDEFTSSLLGDAITDGVFLLGMVWLLIAAELHPDRQPSWTAKNGPFRMRVIGVVFAVSALYTYFTLAPTLSGLPDYDNWARSLLLFLPLDAFVTLRFAWLSRSATSTSWRLVYGALALTGLGILTADALEMMALEDWIPWTGLEPLGLLWFIPYAGLTITARLVAVLPERQEEPDHGKLTAPELVTTEGVIIGLALAILIVHFLAPLTGILSTDLAPVRDRIAVASLSLLGCLAIAQAILLGRRNRELIQDLESVHAKLLQSQKMEAVGRLAGGVAHDFNNILTVVMLNEESLNRKVEHIAAADENLRAIGDACRRAKALTDQLLAFSKDHYRTPEDMDLNTVLDDVSRMLRRLLGDDVRLEFRPDQRGAWITADRTQIEQVIMNLCVNARDAMPGGGLLTVTTTIELVNEEDAQRFGSEAGDHVVLLVTDTGCGMSQEVLEHMFEPFFSTKQRHMGTGLGLSTVYAIVKGASGELTVESVEGKGSNFRLVFPMSSGRTHSPPPPVDATITPQGHGTVLLVEDNDNVREIAQRALESYGFGVLPADSGDAALAIVKNHEQDIELILSDVVMPRMNGPEVVRRALEMRPTMRVLYMSGHTGDALLDHGVRDVSTEFIQKPFTGKQIAQRIQSLLANP